MSCLTDYIQTSRIPQLEEKVNIFLNKLNGKRLFFVEQHMRHVID